eukprot:Phypoly_transcript_10004.p1 GENE.Phypoly_transcript_10004~~Phypoly_transcript_10004.p1  ORF type:complete len:422 (+),score=35.43 Phypoly_transcript_10004:65-1330(+)
MMEAVPQVHQFPTALLVPTDDTIALQLLFDNCPPGGHLVLPVGTTYRITSPLKINKSMTLDGDSTIVCCFPQLSSAMDDPWKQYMTIINATGVTITGIRFANNTNIEGIAALLVLRGDFEISKCIISDFWQGLTIGSNANEPICNVKITNNQITNVRGLPCSPTISSESVTYSNGVTLSSCGTVFIHDNLISAAPGCLTRSGISLGKGSNTVTISNNKVVGNWLCAVSSDGNTFLIEKNILEGCCMVGIQALGQSFNVRDNIIKMAGGSHTDDTCAIQISGVNNGTIIKNMITGTAVHGIFCAPSQVSGNESITLSDNSIEGNFTCGVYVGSSVSVRVEHNKVLLSQTDSNNAPASLQIPIKGNVVPGTAFMFADSTNVELRKNDVSRSKVGYLEKNTTVKNTENDFSGSERATISPEGAP